MHPFSVVVIVTVALTRSTHSQCSCGETNPPPFDWPDNRSFFFNNPTVDGTASGVACLKNCTYVLRLSDDCATLYRGFAVSLYGFSNQNGQTILCFFDGANSTQPHQCVKETTVILDLDDTQNTSVRIELAQPNSGPPSTFVIALVPAGGAKKMINMKKMAAIEIGS